jgi:hypothetical protein
MSAVEIIGLPQSNFVWATRIALAEKGVADKSIPMPPHSPDVLAVHPFCNRSPKVSRACRTGQIRGFDDGTF